MSGGQDPEFQTSVSLIIEIKILNVSAIYNYTPGLLEIICVPPHLYTPLRCFIVAAEK